MLGGNGINVSIMLKNLGWESTALGFAAGFTGEEVMRRLEEMGVQKRFRSILPPEMRLRRSIGE